MKPTPVQWIAWILASASMSAGTVVWAYSTFPSEKVFDLIMQRLDRMENKLDKLFERRR